MPPETPPKPRKWVTRQMEMRLHGDRRNEARAGSDRRGTSTKDPAAAPGAPPEPRESTRAQRGPAAPRRRRG